MKDENFAAYEEDIIGAYRKFLKVSRRIAKRKLSHLTEIAKDVEVRARNSDNRHPSPIYVVSDNLGDGVRRTIELHRDEDIKEFGHLYAEVRSFTESFSPMQRVIGMRLF